MAPLHGPTLNRYTHSQIQTHELCSPDHELPTVQVPSLGVFFSEGNFPLSHEDVFSKNAQDEIAAAEMRYKLRAALHLPPVVVDAEAPLAVIVDLT